MPNRQNVPPAGPVLILTPTGRDAQGAAKLLASENIDYQICPTLDTLEAALDDTVGLVLLADEALTRADLSPLTARLAAQPPWSDLPFVVLTQSGFAGRRQTAEMNLPGKLGNVLFLERPLNALSLVSAVKTAIRARQRQRQVRAYLAEQVGAAERAAALLEARVEERTEALEAAEQARAQIAAALAQSQKMEAVGQLTGGLAHDFNNMLTGIVGSLELMETRIARGQTGQLGHYVALAQTGARRAAALTHRLLAFSRRQTLDPKPIGVNRLVNGMLDLIRSTIGPEITIAPTLTEGPCFTLCDPHQLENALLNLCINARDAMPGGGQLAIETGSTTLTPTAAARLHEARPGDYVTLAITDTGCGMPPDIIARAFDPFFTTKPLGEGTGLGLSMVYGFVQQSGGNVQITSEVGAGTTIRLYMPRHRGDEDTIADRQTAAPAPPRAATHETVLVVDDEPAIRMLVTEVLADLGYEPLVAPDAATGLQLIQTSPRISLLVTDVGMPGMNGRQLADAARIHRPDLKILFITGYAESALAPDGVLAHGMQVISKPFAMETLATRVREMIAH